MSNGRAAAGGETGINGEFYQGGQFLPSSPTTEKGAFKSSKRRKGTGKQEIESYVWKIAPTETAKSIYRQLAGTYAQSNGNDGFKRFEPFIKYQAGGREWDEKINGWTIDELIEMYNSGQRWFEPR